MSVGSSCSGSFALGEEDVLRDMLANASDSALRKVKEFIHRLHRHGAPRALTSLEAARTCRHLPQRTALETLSSYYSGEDGAECIDNCVVEDLIVRGAQMLSTEEVKTLFLNAAHLHLLNDAQLDIVIRASLRREYANGETIIKEGEECSYLGVVMVGNVDVFTVVAEKNAVQSTFSRTVNLAPPVGRDLAGHLPDDTQGSLVPSAALADDRQNLRSAPSTTSTIATPWGHVVATMAVESSVATSPQVTADSSGGYRITVNGEASSTHVDVGHTRSPRSNSSSRFCETRGRLKYSVCGGAQPIVRAVGSTSGSALPGSFPEVDSDEAVELLKETLVHAGSLGTGDLFSLESSFFNEPSQFRYCAGRCGKTVVSLIPISVINHLLLQNLPLGQSIGRKIVEEIDVFTSIREFCRLVFSPAAASNEYLPLWSILDTYTKLNNVIHTKIFSVEVDTGAWGYALKRLPDNVTSTFCFDLAHALPPFVATRMRNLAKIADVKQLQGKRARMRTDILFVRTSERRRCTWQLGMEGKTLVLLRDNYTDLLDFLTMLCIHIIESNKLRRRVQGMVHPPAIDILDEYLTQKEMEDLEGIKVSDRAERERTAAVLARMPLTWSEQEGLMKNWPKNCLQKIYEVMMHREEFNVRVDPSASRKFQINPFHEWALSLRGTVLRKLGLPMNSALPDDLVVDVISSNTHCLKNLLCSFQRKYRDEIRAFALANKPELGRPEEWHTEDDMLYIASSDFIAVARPDLRDEFVRSLEADGITVMEDTAMTGLQADIVPVHLLDFERIDPVLLASIQTSVTKELISESSWRSYCNSDGCFARHHAPSGATQPSVMAELASPSVSGRKGGKARGAKSTQVPTEVANSAADKAGGGAAAAAAGVAENTSHVKRLRYHFIINMDFAFGAQAEGICRTLFQTFAKRIRSISVMGKAGGLVGKRGDIQLATHVLHSKSGVVVENSQDELRSCHNQDFPASRLKELAGDRVDVHEGKVLTVSGTILQNVRLLTYYKRIWNCVGAEMEGSYFARVIEEFSRQGIACPDLVTRFAYYTSDLPLAEYEAKKEAIARAHQRKTSAGLTPSVIPFDASATVASVPQNTWFPSEMPSATPAPGAAVPRPVPTPGGAPIRRGAPATLSAPMRPQEGVPPLYAIARAILERVLIASP